MAYSPSVVQSRRGQRFLQQGHKTYDEQNYQPRAQNTNSAQIENQMEGIPSKSPNHRGDQNNISIKSNPSNENKCRVYVHQFKKIPSKSSSNYNNWRAGSEVHQNMYNHEFSKFSDPKLKTLKKQFDNLSLHSRKLQPRNSPPIISKNPHNYSSKFLVPNYSNQSSKISYYGKSSPTSKINKNILFKPEHKAVVDKLEESYWAKWKPDKTTPFVKESRAKTKGLYTENLKNKPIYRSVPKTGRKEMGDSYETIPEQISETETTSNELVYVDAKETHDEIEIPSQQQPQSDIIHNAIINVHSEMVEHTENVPLMSSGTPILFSQDSELCDSDITSLKHTDSFILTTKMQKREKPHYQQPKCIKLFRNIGYTASTTISVKGGSYPLKSCLKRENPLKPSILGRPGSPLRGITNRRIGNKANRFPK